MSKLKMVNVSQHEILMWHYDQTIVDTTEGSVRIKVHLALIPISIAQQNLILTSRAIDMIWGQVPR